ncbi:hypothetical protein KC318_g8692 [Hortaea werneckii]|nr:hypothetical protein KC334_g8863 [Hortaea werneckii]KAI7004346.1 hypothetical protein KC355_g8762 [Hortaea werneckii]KAI7662758.1 hypothetical protein KC318_g8692 [Hortaea werneckii]
MSGYYNKKLGYYTLVKEPNFQYSEPQNIGFHLHLSTRGDLLDHTHRFPDSIDAVVCKWSSEAAFSHIDGNDIRERIESIQSRSHPHPGLDHGDNLNGGENLNGNEHTATIEQLYNVAKLAATISNRTSHDAQTTTANLTALQADIHSLQATQTNLTAHLPPLQNDTNNLKAVTQFLNHRLTTTADTLSNNLTTNTTRLEHNLATTTAELVRSRTHIADLQRAMQEMAQQLDLLRTLARQNADVTEAKNHRIEALIQAAARDRGNLEELKGLLRMAREEKREGRRRRVVRSFERVFTGFLESEVWVDVEEEDGEEEGQV